MTKFIILFQGRSGSTFLIDALKRHPEIVAGAEILAKHRTVLRPGENPNSIKKLGVVTARLLKGSPSERQIGTMQRFFKKGERKKPVVGFKTKVSDLNDLEGIKDFLESNNVKIIVLDRRNVVKQAISHITSSRLYQRTKDKYPKRGWNLYEENDRLGPQEISKDEFDRYLQRMIFHRRILLAYADYVNVSKLYLEYSDLIKDRNQWFKPIFNFLGIESHSVESSVLKNTDDDLKKAISNFDALKAAYSETEFEAFFDEKSL